MRYLTSYDSIWKIILPCPVETTAFQLLEYLFYQILYHVFLCEIKLHLKRYIFFSHSSFFIILFYQQARLLLLQHFHLFNNPVFTLTLFLRVLGYQLDPQVTPQSFPLHIYCYCELFSRQLICPFILVSFSLYFRDDNFLILSTKWEP